MITAAHTDPHGGEFINLVVSEERAAILKDIAFNLPDIALNERQLCDFEMLATGAFSPLTGFMTQADYEPVVDRMQLADGTLWPVPICLDVNRTTAKQLEAGQSVALRDPEGFLLGILHIADIWPVDREKEALRVAGTSDTGHPAVHYLMHASGDFYVGGRLEVISLPIHPTFKSIRQTPLEVREIFRKLGWKRVVGFQTRQPIHRPQFEMTLNAMKDARANLLLLPNAGPTFPGDFDYYTRVRCYRSMAHYYPPEAFVMNLLPQASRMLGPRDAVLHLIIGKNFGCTHFIIGKGHASPDGGAYYADGDAAQVATAFSETIGVTTLAFEELVYLPFEDAYKPRNEVSKTTDIISFSGNDIRKRIREGRSIPEWATFKEVVDQLQVTYPPPRKQGFTIFLTGLSGAGKSTVARILYARFLEMGERPVTLLDGDIVRRNLSSELNFSKEHRDINVRRIGFVASEITKNRGVAICAPIAPYAKTRAEIRNNIETYGGFIEVHVATPLDICEKRDRKGMYAKARAGLIKGFTGVDDPYEVPEKSELRIDTTSLTPDEAVHEILLYLGQRKFI